MKNCPWFSLRSNSIELRLSSVRRGNFLQILGIESLKTKKTRNSLRSLVFMLASLGLESK
jgi:hypothetical protein